MKLEKLRINRKKKIVIGVAVFLCFISAIMFVGSRAKYKITESIPLVNGTINYKSYDFKMMAMYQANDSGGYTEITRMPDGEYAINEEKSYCKVNDEKDNNARLYTNANGEHVIGNFQKNSKCYVWFDKLTTKKVDTVLGKIDVNIECSDTFSKTATTDEGMCESTDDWGTTYYYRGAVNDNWVQFAGFYWRIIRINGDGSVRMIYNGTSMNQTGAGTQISTSKFSKNQDDNAYIGYMYGTIGSSTYAATHANINNSAIKEVLDTWYKANITDKGYNSKVSNEAGFCNDRNIYKGNTYNDSTTLGYGTNKTIYEPLSRLMTWIPNQVADIYKTIQTPTYKCSQINSDMFTMSSSGKGNRKLTYPIGLITVDEAVYAGAFGGNYNNNDYYLYTNQEYFTMSPYSYATNAWLFVISNNGRLSNLYASLFSAGVRPVINISSNVTITGSGTTSDPYKVV